MKHTLTVLVTALGACSLVACAPQDSSSAPGGSTGANSTTTGATGDDSTAGTGTTGVGTGTTGVGTGTTDTTGTGTTGNTGTGTTGNTGTGTTGTGNGTGMATGAGGASGTTTTAAGGATTGTGGAGTGGAGTDEVVCSNTDLGVLPIDGSGWVAAECNNYGMQGAFYCYDDGVNPSGCTADVVPYVEGSGMCLSGSTTVDPDFAAWGAGIGFSFNDSGETETMASVKGPYDATAAGVTGFSISISGDTGGVPIRIQFTKSAMPDGPSPFIAVPGAGDYPEVMIADAVIPEAWDACTGEDCFADATALYDMQIQIVGGEQAADYDFCVTSIVPIGDGTVTMPGGGALTDYGSSLCGQYDTIDIGPYMVQNNRYNGASHCIQALFDNANTGGFRLTQVNAGIQSSDQGSPPASYPSLVYGWHVDGQFYGGYQSARQLSSITSIPSTFNVTVPSAGANRYNAAYDNWIGGNPNAANEQGTLEHMIWINARDTTPIGTNLNAPVTIAGTQWDVWYGPNGNNGWNTVSYVRATNTSSVDIDVMDFIQDSISRGYTSGSDYLLGVQAGFEIWESTSNFSVDSFTVSVN